MDEFTQNMLDRARQRREALAARIGSTDLLVVRKHALDSNQDANDDSPTKRQCIEELNSPSKLEMLSRAGVLSDLNTVESPRTRAAGKSRFAALAETINNWEDDLDHCNSRKEKRQAPEAPAGVSSKVKAAVVEEDKTATVPPAKPPRTYETDDDDLVENMHPSLAAVLQTETVRQSPVKRQAPAAPALSTQMSVDVPSPVKVAKNSDTVAGCQSPMKAASVDVISNVSSPAKLKRTEGKMPGSPLPQSPAAKPRQLTSGHVSSVTLVFSESRDVAQKSKSPVKMAIVSRQTSVEQPKAAARTTAAVETKSANDSILDEPTKQPVLVRMAAWQTKTAANTPETMPVMSRVKNYEKKLYTGEQSTTAAAAASAKTPLKLRGADAVRTSPSRSAVRPTSVPGSSSPQSRGAGATRASPGKLVTPKVAPATRAIHEKLTQLSESSGRNEAVERERLQRLAELSNVEKRWQHKTNVTDANSATPVPPTAPHLPSGAFLAPPVVHSPGRVVAKDNKREAAREKIRTDFETKLRMMGFDVNSQGSTATMELVTDNRQEVDVQSDDQSAVDSDTGCGDSSAEMTHRQTVVAFNSSVEEFTLSDNNRDSVDSSNITSETSDEAAATTEDDHTTQSEDEQESADNTESEQDDDEEEAESDGAVDDLLNEALDETTEVKEPQLDDTPKVEEVVMRRPRRRSSEHREPGYMSLQEYRRQTARPKSQPPSSRASHQVVREELEAYCTTTVPSMMRIADSPCSPPGSGKKRSERQSPYSVVQCTRTNSPHKNRGKPLMTVMRQSDVSRHEEDDLLPFIPEKSVKQRLQELQNLVNQELNVIQQTSNALNQCCHGNSAFAGSPEAVECHRLLLTACKKREACMIEMQKLREGHGSGTDKGPVHGRLTISDIKLPLKSDFASRIGDTSVFYFVVMIRHGAHVIFTQMVSTHDVVSRNASLDFPNLINLNNISQNFAIDVEVYGMPVTRNTDIITPRKKSKASCTPKKLLTPKASKLLMQSPAGPYAVRTTNFIHIASLQLTKADLARTNFSLDKIPYSFPLLGCIQLRLNCLMQSVVEERGFLTMFEDVSGFGSWHRRWCVLKNNLLSYWKYPDDEKDKEPIGMIELKRCITDEVGLVSRDICARPNTFELKTIRRQQTGEHDTLVTTCFDTMITTKHWLSSDTKEDRLLWTNRLNEALTNIRAWHSDALRPVKRPPAATAAAAASKH